MPNDPDMNFRVRDPVHGFIPFGQQERDVIATWPIQRLRGISQLAFTSLAYPGATHSRFEHALGTMHLAGMIARKVKLPKKERRRIRLAALLHDAGHGPFSHVSEVPMAILTETAGLLPDGMTTKNLHEQVTVELVLRDSELRQAIPARADREWIAQTLDTRNEHPPLLIGRQIVSGAIDADKLDYLMRDSLMAGVRYGIIDVERVVDCCTTWPGREKQLAITHHGIPAVDQVVVARYHMTEQVYRHKTRRITDVMVQRAAIEAGSCGCLDRALKEAFVFRARSRKWRQAFLATDDAWLLHRFLGQPATSAPRKIVERLRARRLPKEVFGCKLRELGVGAEARQRLQREREQQKDLEQRLADLLGTEPHLTFLDIRSRENPLYRSPDVPLEKEIKVIRSDGSDEKLGDCPESLCNTVKVESEASLHVYAPMDSVAPQHERQPYEDVRAKVLDAIREWFGGWSHVAD